MSISALDELNIVCISTSDWDKPWGSRQQIMSRLSSKNRILFVEYQASILHALRSPKLLLKAFTSKLKIVNSNLIIYRPILNVPFGHYCKYISCINQILLLWQLKLLSKKLKISNILLWIYDPTAYFLLGKLEERVSVYHCIDSHKDEKSSFFRKRCIGTLEEKLCKKCDIIFASTDNLLEEKKNLNQETYLLPSGANELYFKKAPTSLDDADFQVVRSANRPRIGCVGTFDHRIDTELVNEIATKYENGSIIFIGYISDPAMNRLTQKKLNVHVLEWKDNNLLTNYINEFDICIIPYKVNNFTKGISSVKVFDYLAVGKPVVSTDLPSLMQLHNNGLIKVAKNHNEFLEHIDRYLVEEKEDSKKVNARIEYACHNTWKERVVKIDAVIGEFLKKGQK